MCICSLLFVCYYKSKLQMLFCRGVRLVAGVGICKLKLIIKHSGVPCDIEL
jgi:hypothetical protein